MPFATMGTACSGCNQGGEPSTNNPVSIAPCPSGVPCSACHISDGNNRSDGVGVVERGLDVERLRKRPIVHMIICALDYKGTKRPLSCTQDGKNMMDLARMCGVNVREIYDNDATIEGVSKLVKEMGARCKPDDYFVFYFAGHGTEVADTNGDEEDNFDEAFCLVDEQGGMSKDTYLKDEEFVNVITGNVKVGAKIVVIADCCHSATAADVNNPRWDGYKVVSISGCKDAQTSGDTGRGGIFTHSLLYAIERFQAQGQSSYTIDGLFVEILNIDDAVFKSKQDISMCSRPKCPMSWPLVPTKPYSAPIKCLAAGGQ